MNNFLFERVDNSRLIVFRILFGVLMMAECWGAIATGWVHETFVSTDFTFNFIGFDWTQVLLGNTMYGIYGIMGLLGLLIALGMFYRPAIVLFFILWSLTYFMQKSHYNNHYYLVMLVSFLMIWMPANNYLSVDSSSNTRIKSQTVYRWNYLIFQILICCVYLFAAIAKLNPDWLDNHFLPLRLNSSANWFENKFGENHFSSLLRTSELSQILAYAGVAFDFLIVPLLLIKPTRNFAFIAALIFHLFNSITLHIGIFPYFALALCIFFFNKDEIKKWFLPFKTRNTMDEREFLTPFKQKLITWFIIVFTAFMIYLPLRHYLIPGDVLWTDEGHRLSWRMMLRSKAGTGEFFAKTKNGEERVSLVKILRPHQINNFQSKPDMIWQMAQKLKADYKAKGEDSVQIFFRNSKVKINDGPYHDFIDPYVDLANTKWSYFGHQQWILPEPKDYYKTDKKLRRQD